VAVRAELAAVDAITTEARWAFPAPLASMLRSWVDRYRGENIAASLASLEDAIRRDRRPGISRATAYRYLDEVITVLPDEAPELSRPCNEPKTTDFRT
jgi:hypothetical protein